MMEHMKLGFPLELYAPYEYSMVFNYLTYTYSILQNNRRIMMFGFCEDLFRSKSNDFNISSDRLFNDEFNKRRSKMNPLQKLVCDQYIFYNAMQELSIANALLYMLLMKHEYIKNPLRGQFGKDKAVNFIEENTYKRRFFLFKYVQMPRYQEYEEYENLYNKVHDDGEQEATNQMRSHFMNGMKMLNQLKSIDEKLRNTEILSNEILDDLIKVSATSLLLLMKAQSCPPDKKIKVNIDSFATEWIPSVDMEFV